MLCNFITNVFALLLLLELIAIHLQCFLISSTTLTAAAAKSKCFETFSASDFKAENFLFGSLRLLSLHADRLLP